MGFLTDVLSSGVRLSTPIALAACGELVSERGGVLNIGLEGMMVTGGFAAFYVLDTTHNPLLAILAALVAGMLVAMLMVVVSVRGGANQIVAGLAIVVLAPGIVDFLYTQSNEGFSSIQPFGPLAIPLLHRIPVIGRALFGQNAFFYGLVGLALLLGFVLTRTRFGLEVTAVGHDPDVAEAKGVGALRVRTIATLVAGACGGLGGAALTIGALGTYSPGVVGGRGFVAIAVVILGGWRLRWVLFGAALFGVTDALQLRLTNVVSVSVNVFAMLPWVVVLVMLVTGSKNTVIPRSLGGLARSD